MQRERERESEREREVGQRERERQREEIGVAGEKPNYNHRFPTRLNLVSDGFPAPN